ncbi:MAG: hypothetical protein IT324_32625 [Anaerolineae bacterium]|nr:hypothetical protein [Anaerolineae bacterium]
MDAVKLTVTVNEDRRVVIDLPADMPIDPAEIVVRSFEQPAEQSQRNIPSNPAREAARAKLLAAGFLVTDIHPPEGTVPLTPEEDKRLSALLSDPNRSALDLINEDRGEY